MRFGAALVVLCAATSAQAETFDPMAALRDAQARGLKATYTELEVKDAVTCPTIAASKTSLAKFRASGAIARFALGIDGFLRADFGVPEAIALLGEPVWCIQAAGSSSASYELAPRSKTIRRVTLQLVDGELVGAMIEVEPPRIPLDVEKLLKRRGPVVMLPGLHAGGAPYEVTSGAFSGSVKFESAGVSPADIVRIRYRRTPMIEVLPKDVVAVADVARLVKLAVRVRAPAPDKFHDTLGMIDSKASTADRAVFMSFEGSNVAAASSTRTASGHVKAIDITLGKPIKGDAAALAKALGAKRSIAAGKSATIEVTNGTVRVEPATGNITRFVIER